jgi:phosphomannomutase
VAEELIISISGMRGIVGENLTPSVAEDYGCAFGTYLKKRNAGSKESLSVCVGRDSRHSGEMLKTAFTAGLAAVGLDAIDLGIATTPCVGVMLNHLGCNGGVIITASHNPIQYNGIKLLLDNGTAPPPPAAKEIKKCFFDKGFSFVDSADRGRVTSCDRTNDVHIDRVLTLVDKEAIKARKFRVALDSVNGAGGRITKRLLAEFGCEVIAINDEPTGRFTHSPEPIAENLGELCEVVKHEKAEIGFAQDPDADRLAIVNEAGKCVGEEYTLALAAQYIFSKTSGSAATNLSTSRMIDDIAKKFGSRVIRTPVGEANVAAVMNDYGCIIGGEGNGGVIDLRVGPVRNSLVGIALVLALLAETGLSISELVGQIGGYCMIKEKVAADKVQAEKIMDSAKKVFAGARLDGTDGCRFDFDDGWVHLRSSNTEPVMRIIAEAQDEPTARKYIDAVSNIRKEIFG